MAARIVFMTRARSHVSPLLKQLHWLPMESRVNFKVLLLTFKGLRSLAPSYICELLMDYVPSKCNLRSSEQKLLIVPRSNFVRAGDRAFSVLAPKLWNALPLDIKCATSVEHFKGKLKAHLFVKAFSDTI